MSTRDKSSGTRTTDSRGQVQCLSSEEDVRGTDCWTGLWWDCGSPGGLRLTSGLGVMDTGPKD